MVGTDFISRYPRLLTLLNLLLGILILLALFLSVRGMLSRAVRRIEAPLPPPRSAVPDQVKDFGEYAQILSRNPFGFPAGQLKKLNVPQGASAAPTEFTLVGTVSGPERYSYAVFADKSGRQEVFRVGEAVFGGGRLKRVFTDKVSISENGTERKVELTDIIAIKEVSQPDASRPQEFVRSTGAGTFIVDQKKILQSLENPAQLMTDARLQPNIQEGKQEGYILREVKSGGIYQSLGLRNGDVLLRINEYNISHPENALQAFTALKGMDRVQVDLLRNGAKMTLTYQIR